MASRGVRSQESRCPVDRLAIASRVAAASIMFMYSYLFSSSKVVADAMIDTLKDTARQRNVPHALFFGPYAGVEMVM